MMPKFGKYFLLIFLFCFLSNEINSFEYKIDDKANKKTINSIKESIEKNKKYIPSNNLELLNKIIIGVFTYDPIAVYEFRKNGTFTVWYYQNWHNLQTDDDIKIEKGRWHLEKNFLKLEINQKIVSRVEIKYFYLRYNKRFPVKYTFDIELNGKVYKGGNQLRKEFN